MSKVEFFKPEDFKEVKVGREMQEYISDIANRKLEERGVRVVGQFNVVEEDAVTCDRTETWVFGTYAPKALGRVMATHTALLIDVQPIKRGVTKDEIAEMKEKLSSHSWELNQSDVAEFLDRIEREGVLDE
jgi:hypothetical protein